MSSAMAGGFYWSKRLPERLKENPGKDAWEEDVSKRRQRAAASNKHSRACREVKCPHGGSSGTIEKCFWGQERIAQVKNEWGKQVIKIPCINIS